MGVNGCSSGLKLSASDLHKAYEKEIKIPSVSSGFGCSHSAQLQSQRG